jgi:hypothetical protein
MALLDLAAHSVTDQRRRTAFLMVGIAGRHCSTQIHDYTGYLRPERGWRLEVAAPLL